ncbi:uncharacterized protein VTP21DRAFT_1816 [Calcarisporiella thermophila]|uniref:uncharacterized protein n=1 Tax=Calcarisporiella thermophila TaxID=911321 RepID=UPI00374212C0
MLQPQDHQSRNFNEEDLETSSERVVADPNMALRPSEGLNTKPPLPNPPKCRSRASEELILQQQQQKKQVWSNEGSDRVMEFETAVCNDTGAIRDKGRRGNSVGDSPRPTFSSESVRSKKKKRPPLKQSTTPADIFAANVAEAVEEAQATEDDEQFVYRDGGLHSHSSSSNSLAPFPQGHGTWSPALPPPMTPHHPVPEPSEPSLNPVRPRYSRGQDSINSNDHINNNGRMRVSRKISTGSVSSLESFGQRPVVMRAAPEIARTKGGYGHLYTHSPHNYSLQEWYTHDEDERIPFIPKSPRYRSPCRRIGDYFLSIVPMLCLIFMLSIMAAIFSLSIRPLTDVSISEISNVLAAQRELIFDMHVRARNRNLWSVQIDRADLGVFASPAKKKMSAVHGSEPREFLGNVRELDEPLVFSSGLDRWGVVSVATSQVRIKNPGESEDGDDRGNENWARIIRMPFDLIVRGQLKYRLLWFRRRGARVCLAVTVDPETGEVSFADETRKLCERGDDPA